ncbi:MAG: hypothetical protein AAF429_13085 [Pseudomonadota bacterium]
MTFIEDQAGQATATHTRAIFVHPIRHFSISGSGGYVVGCTDTLENGRVFKTDQTYLEINRVIDQRELSFKAEAELLNDLSAVRPSLGIDNMEDESLRCGDIWPSQTPNRIVANYFLTGVDASGQEVAQNIAVEYKLPNLTISATELHTGRPQTLPRTQHDTRGRGDISINKTTGSLAINNTVIQDASGNPVRANQLESWYFFNSVRP